ncbi:glycoside hydrolase domain-containing protein [Kribbella deserti]|uniref:Glycoside hydrolase domain-containing protein n=1 Tax=Kribbella deserti TaxID=1926257 RepID=A0ABV6QF65_9ACTN
MSRLRKLVAALVPTLLLTSAVLPGSEAAPIAAPGAVAATAATGFWTESAYTSVFQDSRPSADAGSSIRLDTARNEYEGAQIVVRRNDAFTVNGVTFTDLTSGVSSIPAANLEYKFVDHVQLTANSNFFGPITPVLRAAPAKFPDVLSNDPTRAVPARTTQPIWVRVYVPGTVPGGLYRGTATVRTTSGDLAVPVEVDVRAVTLPEAANGAFTTVLWNHFGGEINADQEEPDFIKRAYGFDKYSAEWWQLLDNVTQERKKHRTNALTVGMLRLLMDAGSKKLADGSYTFVWSRFDQVVERILAGGGISRIEGFYWGGGPGYNNPELGWHVSTFDANSKHLWVPWNSAAANSWFSQFIPALKAHLDSKGWSGKFFMHVGDEVHGDHGETAWRGIAAKIRSHWPDVKLGDAMVHDPWVSRLAPYTDVMIPQLRTYSDNPAAWDTERAKGKELWLYTANAPTINYLNRAIDQPQWAQRQLAWFAYSRRASGYLHWAFNQWEFVLNREDLPAGTTCCAQDLKGDGWIVQKDVERKTVKSTVRYEALRDGVEDFEVLTLLGKTNPEQARELAGSMVPLGDKYSPDSGFMQRVRRIALDLAAGRTVADIARTATASAPSGNASAAIDGDTATVWQPSGSTALTVDLGHQAQLDVLRLRWSTAAAATFEISYDGSRWTPVPIRAQATALNVKARYVRLTTAGSLASLELNGARLAATNLAGGKTFSARSQQPDGRWPDASQIESTDGLLADEWSDARSHGYTAPAGTSRAIQLTLDLGAVKVTDNVRIHAYEEYLAYRPDSVSISTSVDGTRFVQRGARVTPNGTAGLWYDARFGAAPARYVKVTLTKAFTADASAVFVDEVEVYEASAPAQNLALGRTYSQSGGIDPAYPDGRGESTDGVVAGGYTDGHGYGYKLPAGQAPVSVDVSVDLGTPRPVSRVRTAAFDDGVHDYAPDRVQVLVGGAVLAEAHWPTGGWHELSFPTLTTKDVTLRFTKWNAHFADYLFLDEIEVYGPGTRAEIKYAPSAGLDPSYGDSGSESTDGILAGHYTDTLSYGWQYSSAPPQPRTATVDVDLGTSRTVDHVALREYFDGVHNYKPDSVAVLTSADGVDYTQRSLVTAPTSRWFDLAFPAVNARHIRLRLTKTWADFGDYVFLDEITVHTS